VQDGLVDNEVDDITMPRFGNDRVQVSATGNVQRSRMSDLQVLSTLKTEGVLVVVATGGHAQAATLAEAPAVLARDGLTEAEPATAADPEGSLNPVTLGMGWADPEKLPLGNWAVPFPLPPLGLPPSQPGWWWVPFVWRFSVIVLFAPVAPAVPFVPLPPKPPAPQKVPLPPPAPPEGAP
jgi:hypothetical protein